MFAKKISANDIAGGKGVKPFFLQRYGLSLAAIRRFSRSDTAFLSLCINDFHILDIIVRII